MHVNSGMPLVGAVAALMGDATRAEVLTALVADRALSATELADVAGVTKSTISAHLEKLLRAGLVAVNRQGRHRYYRLAHADVARALEALMGVAWRTGAVRVHSRPTDPALRKARVCYDHLAGEMGVFVYESLLRSGALITRAAPGSARSAVDLTATGQRLIQKLGIEVDVVRGARRSFCHACLDWSERRHHLAGALGTALLQRITDLHWARREKHGRVVSFSAAGEAALRRALEAQSGP